MTAGGRPTVGAARSGRGPAPSGRSRRGVARSRSDGRRSGTARQAPVGASGPAAARPSCPGGRDGREASMRSCRCSTRAASRRAFGPSSGPVTRSTAGRRWDRDRRRRRDLSARRRVQVRADGARLQPRMGPAAGCRLVATGFGGREGARRVPGRHGRGRAEPARPRRGHRGAWLGHRPRDRHRPFRQIGHRQVARRAMDGAPAPWTAVVEARPETRHRRRRGERRPGEWSRGPHPASDGRSPRTANVPGEVPEPCGDVGPACHPAGRDPRRGGSRHGRLRRHVGREACRAATCLRRTRRRCPPSTTPPPHVRTTCAPPPPLVTFALRPCCRATLESASAAVRHRAVRTEGALPREPARPIALAPIRAASRTWRRPSGANRSPPVLRGATSGDGIATTDAANTAARSRRVAGMPG